MKFAAITFFYVFFLTPEAISQQSGQGNSKKENTVAKSKTFYGTASYYADKFIGRKTATGELYNQNKLTAACNTLPLGTWVRVTNLRNKRSVVVKINDRLHPKNKRIVDLSRIAAEKLGYIRNGLTKVKVEVLDTKSNRLGLPRNK